MFAGERSWAFSAHMREGPEAYTNPNEHEGKEKKREKSMKISILRHGNMAPCYVAK